MSTKFWNVTQCGPKYNFIYFLRLLWLKIVNFLSSCILFKGVFFFIFFSLFFFLFSYFSLSFSIWVWRRCGWLRGFVDFITRIFSGMKLNANTEQIEGKLYFNIRGNFSLKLGWGRCLIKHVYTIIIIFKIFTPLLFSKCLKHFYFPSFQNVYTTIIIFFLLKIQRVYTISISPLFKMFLYFLLFYHETSSYVYFLSLYMFMKKATRLVWGQTLDTHQKKSDLFLKHTDTTVDWIFG